MFFNPSFFLIFSLWKATVLGEEFNNSLISLFVLPCLRRFATWISVGVRSKYSEDNLCENGETMSLRFDPRVLTQFFVLLFIEYFLVIMKEISGKRPEFNCPISH